MDRNSNYLALKKYSLGQGIDLFGVADIRSIKQEFTLSHGVTERFDQAVSLGARLSEAVLEEIVDAPTRLYFYHYKTVNALLDQAAVKIANYIQRKGFSALPIPASQIVDWQAQKAHLSHKKIGYLAGIGWIGRNNLLVHKGLGSSFRLSTILTDMPLKIDKPVKDNCGICKACLAPCPAGAIKTTAGDFLHQNCFEKLKEFQKLRLVDQYICGVCVKNCKGENK